MKLNNQSFKCVPLSLLIIIMVNSCSSFSLYKNAISNTKTLFSSNEFHLSDNIKNLPYAMQLVEHENFSIVAVLGKAIADQETFYDSENASFTLKNGKVISTRGIEHDIEILNPPNLKEIYFQLLKSNEVSLKYESFIRFKNPSTPYLSIHQEYKLHPNDFKALKRKINGEYISYLLLEENFEVLGLNWKGTNIYWLRDDGLVLKSKQEIFPKSKYFFETLKEFIYG